MSTPSSKPTVLIVGGGLGGLMLGALLEKAAIPYTIFERTPTIKPLGSVMFLGPNIMPLFAQLGIEEEFIALGRKSLSFDIERENKGHLATVDYKSQIDYTGYYSYIVSRPTLYDLLLKLVPSEKILFGKRVLTIAEEDDKVKIQTADNCIYEGDILVGADGAYSAVRQRMYEKLKKEGNLPKSDQENLPFLSTCLVGQTKPLDPAEFPEIKGTCHTNTLGNGKPFSWVTMPTAQNTFCWMVMHHLDEASSKAAEEHRFRELQNSEWGPYAAESMCEETRDFPITLGGKNLTMGDIYDWTPKEQIAKVMLEEKVFQTWHSGRTVLIGDACHKLNPTGGQGAIIAMHGALALANMLYAMPSNTSEEIEKAFAAYKAERIGPAKEVFKSCAFFSKFLEKGFVGVTLMFMMRRLPAWVIDIATRGMLRYRPTSGYLPKVENKGSIPAAVSPSAEKAREMYERRNSAACV
ncbi:hypothetical protein BGX33_003725 [Mortierella sp. NVP41]|nr:hypothetical protein BGX33_003725 [Mortierella sp. NVP41]